WHTREVTRYFKPAFGTRSRASLIAGFAFRMSFTYRRSMKSSTTVAIAYVPPSLSYREFCFGVASWPNNGTSPPATSTSAATATPLVSRNGFCRDILLLLLKREFDDAFQACDRQPRIRDRGRSCVRLG